MLMKFMEILVSQGGSQGAIQGGSSSARLFDLACRGVVPPLLQSHTVKEYFHYGCAALRVASDSER